MTTTVSAITAFICSLCSTKMVFLCIFLGTITETIFSVSAVATDIRLGNITMVELKLYEGPIEVFVDGEWGAIQRNGIDDVTAKTVCKILGYGFTGFRVDKFQFYSQTKLTRLKCAGHETSILECQQEARSVHGAYDVPGVHCFEQVFTEVRLSSGGNPTQGNVQVKMDGRWGRFCSYDGMGAALPSKPILRVICRTLGFQFSNNILATSIRSTKREEVYDTIVGESDAIDAKALRVTKNKNDGYLEFESVNKIEPSLTYEKGLARDKNHEYLDLKAVEQGEYDYPYTGQKLSEKGYKDVSGVRGKLPEIQKNASTTGTEGSNDPYSELDDKKKPDHMYERMADEDGYLNPFGGGNVKPVEI